MNQERRIEYFMSEISRLSNQVVDLQYERDALAARLSEIEKSDSQEVLSLKADNQALAAQVEALKAAIDVVRKVGNKSGFGSQSPASVRAERLAWLRLAEVVELTPQQLLQEVKAQAGRKGYAQALFDQFAGNYQALDELKDKPDQYADSIRKGGTA